MKTLDSHLPAVRTSTFGLAIGPPAIWGWDVERTVQAVDTKFALPAGTVTLLLTDIEGSTRLWEASPAAMAQAVPMHYEILADAIARHGGIRPIEQGEGDRISFRARSAVGDLRARRSTWRCARRTSPVLGPDPVGVISRRLELQPPLRFKLDPSAAWTDDIVALLAATRAGCGRSQRPVSTASAGRGSAGS